MDKLTEELLKHLVNTLPELGETLIRAILGQGVSKEDKEMFIKEAIYLATLKAKELKRDNS